MITTALPRLSRCYLKSGNSYLPAKFLSLNQMPTAPHAVKIVLRGSEFIAMDFQVMTPKEKFEDKNGSIIGLLIGKYNCAKIARDLGVPYCRVLSVRKQAKELGIIHAKETETV